MCACVDEECTRSTCDLAIMGTRRNMEVHANLYAVWLQLYVTIHIRGAAYWASKVWSLGTGMLSLPDRLMQLCIKTLLLAWHMVQTLDIATGGTLPWTFKVSVWVHVCMCVYVCVCRSSEPPPPLHPTLHTTMDKVLATYTTTLQACVPPNINNTTLTKTPP